MAGTFTKAVKRQAKLRQAVNGPSGAGKTYTALAIGAELARKEGKRMAVIDTEHGSAAKYAYNAVTGTGFDFDVVELSAPFNPGKYVEYIKAAQGEGYGVIVIDSLTHAWAGTGGLLEMVEQIAKDKAAKFKSSPDTYAAWNEGKRIQSRFVEAILAADIHVIATMRSKQEYERQTEGNRTRIVKLGMAPIQADNMDYEFDIVLDMDEAHQGFVSKSRCPEVDGKVYPKPGAAFAAEVIAWLEGAEPLAKKVDPEPEKPKFVPATSTNIESESTALPLGEARTPAEIKEWFNLELMDGGEGTPASSAAAFKAVKFLVGSDKENVAKLLKWATGAETFVGLPMALCNRFVEWSGMIFCKAEAAAILNEVA